MPRPMKLSKNQSYFIVIEVTSARKILKFEPSWFKALAMALLKGIDLN